MIAKVIDPLTRRELLGASRRWQTYVFRGFYVFVIGLIIWAFWNNLTGRGNVLTVSDYAELARNLFSTFTLTQAILIGLCSASITSDAVSREVRGGTLGLLLLTPLTPWTIVLGKWKSAMVMIGSVIFAGVPVLAVCVYLGGITAYDLVWSLSLTLALGALGTSTGLLFSCFFKTGYGALIVTVLSLIMYTFGPMIPAVSIRGREWIEIYTWVHPIWSMGRLLFDTRTGDPSACWIGATLTSFGVSTGLLAWAATRVEELARRIVEPPAVSKAFRFMDRAFEKFSPGKSRAWIGRETVWEDRPMLWKELRTRASGKLRYAMRIALGLFALLAIPFAGSEEGCLWAGGVFLGIILLFVWFLVSAATGASLFVKEKEEKKWDLLLSTPLTSAQIVWPKLVGGGLSLLPMTAALMGAGLLFSLLREVPIEGYLLLVGIYFLFGLFVFLFGSWISLQVRTTRNAFSITSGTVLAILIFIPAFCGLADLDGSTSQSLIDATNPVVYLEILADKRVPVRLWEWEGVTMFLIIYAGASFLLLALMIGRFGKYTQRTAG